MSYQYVICGSGFGGLGVSVLDFSTQVRGFKPANLGFLRAKNPQHVFLQMEK
jgi:hypothetical protein